MATYSIKKLVHVMVFKQIFFSEGKKALVDSIRVIYFIEHARIHFDSALQNTPSVPKYKYF